MFQSCRFVSSQNPTASCGSKPGCPNASASGAPGFHPPAAVGSWDATTRQDWRTCERSQLGVSSRAYARGPYSPREGISAAWDREFLRAIGHSR